MNYLLKGPKLGSLCTSSFGWHYSLCHTCKVFESSLNNNLKLFFSMSVNWNRIIWSFVLTKQQVLVWAGCFLPCVGPVKNIWCSAMIKKYLMMYEGKKKNMQAFLHDLLSILIIPKVKIQFEFTFYFTGFWTVHLELQHIKILHFW